MDRFPLRKVLLFLLVLYALTVSFLAYWQLIRTDLAHHSLNPRTTRVFWQDRGTIYDRKGQPLASSELKDGRFYRTFSEVLSLSHVVGYFHPRYGMSNLEASFHSYLSRKSDIHTTIDLKLQQDVEGILGERVGAVVLMRPDNGQILAMVSSPAVDSTALTGKWEQYQQDQDSPFLNRATQGLYPPGSVIKPLLLAAGYQEGIITPDQKWRDNGSIVINQRTISNYRGVAHGTINSNEALAYSSNVVFSELAVELGPTLLEYLRDFGWDRSLDLGIPVRKGLLPTVERSAYGWAQLGIGQADLLTTPLRMAMAISSIGAGGTLYQPYLVRRVTGWLGLGQIRRPRQIGQPVAPHVARQVTEAMVAAVEFGTASAARIAGTTVAGKTGTAQNPQGADHSWFVGFAPADSPRVAVAVVVEHGGFGGALAAPIGRDSIKAALESMEER